MSYINIETLEKVEAADIMRAYPNISFPNRGWDDSDILPLGYAELHMPAEHPMPGKYEKLVEVSPIKVDDKWYRKFEVAPLSEEEVQQKNDAFKEDLFNGVRDTLHNFAQSVGYDSILSMTTYAASSNPKYSEEGQKAVEYRDQMWNKVYEILSEVANGTRPMPTSYAEIVPELPKAPYLSGATQFGNVAVSPVEVTRI